MISSSLGRLEKVDLRTVWVNEATSFTPWLAQEVNLKLLGDAIGVDLALEAQERNVGLFRADLLCKDTSNDQWILIENQIERTDHSHLGQLITYAAGLHAVTIVWIAARFTDEHRAALDWLNEVTGESVSFFGLEVELWRIGGSPAAPKFNVVCKPNEFVKRVTCESQTPSPGNTRYIEYWQAFKDLVELRSSVIRPTKPLPQYWTNISIGRTGFQLRAAASMRDHYIRVDLVTLDDPDGRVIQHLANLRGDLEAIMPGAVFNEKSGIKESAIEFRRKDDPNVVEDWPNQHAWMLAALEALYKVFAPAIRELPSTRPSIQIDNPM